ncbi:hypothetical protein TRVL_05176 [Trypanosoma vivax]|nr:hypothetical protein TRVL_05176 [Trypanosoma vivax]
MRDRSLIRLRFEISKHSRVLDSRIWLKESLAALHYDTTRCRSRGGEPITPFLGSLRQLRSSSSSDSIFAEGCRSLVCGTVSEKASHHGGTLRQKLRIGGWPRTGEQKNTQVWEFE